MTRSEFIDRLRKGLTGLPPATIADAIADYEAHFTEGLAAGRTEAEVAAALGEPYRLAKEIRAEAGMKQWEEAKTPGSAATALLGIIGLGALDIFILLPILMWIIGALFGFFGAAIGAFIGGGVMMVAGPFTGMPGGVTAAVLGGFGLMAGALAVAGLTTAFTIWLVNGLIWYGRLHYKVLKPALEPNAPQSGSQA